MKEKLQKVAEGAFLIFAFATVFAFFGFLGLAAHKQSQLPELRCERYSETTGLQTQYHQDIGTCYVKDQAGWLPWEEHIRQRGRKP